MHVAVANGESRVQQPAVVHHSLTERGVEILLCTRGDGTLVAGGQTLAFQRGDSFLIPAAVPSYRITGKGRLFRAGITPD